MTDRVERRGRLGSFLRNVTRGAENALEIARVGRLSPELHTPYTIVRRERTYKLRHYESSVAPRLDSPLLLVPPLMVTPEVYDIDPTLSAVGALLAAGVDTWVLDFGIPEQEEGGLSRTLDDHVRAVDHAIEDVRRITGQDVHLAGYSQGGMFVYQATALRRSANIRSLITFGAPVDLHRNLVLQDELVARLVDALGGGIRRVLASMEGLPGAFSSIGFRVLSARKELKQMASLVAHLHDREALMRGESSRRFLHGEGFVYWPGPALRTFYEEFVVDNRLSQGGFVVDGQSLTLADVEVPILYFYGVRDEFARKASVRAIREAALRAECYEAALPTGHFGLVVGRVAMLHTWPTTVQWMRWLEGKAERPPLIRAAAELSAETSSPPPAPTAGPDDGQHGAQLLLDVAREAAESVSKSAHGVSRAFTTLFDNVRYQLPRLALLERLEPDSRVSVGRELAQKAAEMGEQTFFLWQGRAHTYAEADRRVSNIVRGLIACGVERAMHVGVLMRPRPTYLSLYTALSRLGAVAVLLPDPALVSLGEALELGSVQVLICDPEHVAEARDAFRGPVLLLGGARSSRAHDDSVIDMEEIDPAAVTLPSWYEPNPGRARELAVILFTTGKDERPRAARITNWRWAVSAYGAAAATMLTAKDTVYCAMPLHHAAGLLVSVGGALVGGARLALSSGFRAELFWTEVRRAGVSVVFYAGEMMRELLDAPKTAVDAKNPIRLFAGSGMRIDMWQRITERFRARVLEFYATTEGKAVLANVEGEKIGSLGRPLPGTADMLLAAYALERDELLRDVHGRAVPCSSEQPGMLIVRIEAGDPSLSGDSERPEAGQQRRIVRDVQRPGDAWFVTGDLLRRDADGDYWFVDRSADLIRTRGGPVSCSSLEDTLYALGELKQVVAYAVRPPFVSHDVPAISVVARAGYALDLSTLIEQVRLRLEPHALPWFVRVATEVPMSLGFRPRRAALRALPLAPDQPDLYCFDHERARYVPATREAFEALQRADATLSGKAEESAPPR